MFYVFGGSLGSWGVFREWYCFAPGGTALLGGVFRPVLPVEWIFTALAEKPVCLEESLPSGLPGWQS